MSKTPSKSRGFTMTVFDYDNKIEFMKKFFEGMEYFCMGEELTKSGKKHLQCYFYMKYTRSFTGVLKMIKKSILNGAKLMIGKDPDINWQAMYCMKEGNYFYESGTRPKQGERKDLSLVRSKLLETGKMRDIVDITENMQAIRGCEKYLSYKETIRSWKPWVIWFYGPTGTGKSRRARWILNPEDTWTSGGSLKWFDRYDAHEDVHFEDFRGNHCSYSFLLRLLDRYEMSVEVKGGHRQFLPKRIIITSHKSPEECYSGLDEGIDQLLRRIDIIHRVHENGADVLEHKSGVILDPDFCSSLRNYAKKCIEGYKHKDIYSIRRAIAPLI